MFFYISFICVNISLWLTTINYYQPSFDTHQLLLMMVKYGYPYLTNANHSQPRLAKITMVN